jgi:hypothetical protein
MVISLTKSKRRKLNKSERVYHDVGLYVFNKIELFKSGEVLERDKSILEVLNELKRIIKEA